MFHYKQKQVKGHKRHTPKTKKLIDIDPYDRKQRYRTYAEISLPKARQLFEQRSKRAKMMDLRTTAKNSSYYPNEKWSENIGRYDVKGIDTKKLQWENDWEKAKEIQDRMGEETKLKEEIIILRKEYNALPEKGKYNLGSHAEELAHKIRFLERQLTSLETENRKKEFKMQVQEFALNRDFPASETQFRRSALHLAFSSYKEYVEQWAYEKTNVQKGEKAPRKRCSQCGMLYDKRLLTEGKCPECYWDHLYAVSHMGASPSQYQKENARFRSQLANYIKKKHTPKKETFVEIDIWTNDLERFENDFSNLNDVKMDETQIINKGDEHGKRYAVFCRNFGGKLKYPAQTYYQLNNSWEKENKKSSYENWSSGKFSRA